MLERGEHVGQAGQGEPTMWVPPGGVDLPQPSPGSPDGFDTIKFAEPLYRVRDALGPAPIRRAA